MNTIGVKELTRLSGVSIRTLHYYDKIGLLKPGRRSETGYRYYGEKELYRLQQILLYKELDVPLKTISGLLDDPEFDALDTLDRHKETLIVRQQRISDMIATIDNTINHIKKGERMSKPEDLYKGLPGEMGTQFREEVKEKYGKKVLEQSERELEKLGKEGFEKLKAEMDWIFTELFVLREKPPADLKVQELIAVHYQIIRRFWGTVNSEDKQAEAYAGLGQLYVSDERFTTINGQFQPEFARFMQKAMSRFANTQLK